MNKLQFLEYHRTDLEYFYILVILWIALSDVISVIYLLPLFSGRFPAPNFEDISQQWKMPILSK